MFLFTAAAALLPGPFNAFAQNDKSSGPILSAASARYKSFSSIKAEFSYTIENPKEKTNQKQTGTLSVKGNKYRLAIKGQEIFCDGKTVWTYLEDAKEVQVNEPGNDPDALSPANIFTIYEKGFDHMLAEEKNENGKEVQIIDLKPTDAKKKYFKIRMTFDKKEKLLLSALIFYKDGSRHTYTISKFTQNEVMPDAFFTFDKAAHGGVEVIDLR